MFGSLCVKLVGEFSLFRNLCILTLLYNIIWTNLVIFGHQKQQFPSSFGHFETDSVRKVELGEQMGSIPGIAGRELETKWGPDFRFQWISLNLNWYPSSWASVKPARNGSFFLDTLSWRRQSTVLHRYFSSWDMKGLIWQLWDMIS